MFFLHDLDLTREICLPEVLPMDDLKVLQSLGVTLTRKKNNNLPSPVDPDPSNHHPLGEAPTWAEVERCIEEEPWKLMRTWNWSEERLGSLNLTACQLFQKFTIQIWTCLNTRWRTDQEAIRPTTLQEALKCWTLEFVHARIKSVAFVACNANLPGSVPGRRMSSFSDRQSLYFPTSSDNLVHYWHLLAIHPGYIAEYQDICSKLSPDDVEELNSDLATLLSECQCLPQSTQTSEGTSGTQQAIWKGKNQRILVLTNPLFYKLGHISNSSHRSSIRAPPTHTPTKVLQTHLLEQAGIPNDIARKTLNWSRSLQKKAYAKGNRSHKAKNRRAPPQRQKKHRDASTDDDDTDVSSKADGRTKRRLRSQSQRSGRHVLNSDPDLEDNMESLDDESVSDKSKDDSDYENDLE